MTDQRNLNWHIRRTLILGIPIVVSQVLQILIGVTDSLMVARLGELPLAQVTLGSQVIFFAIIVAVGFSIPVMALLSSAIAKDEQQTIRRVTRMGLWQAVMISAFFLVLFQFSEPILRRLGQEEAVIDGAVRYIEIAAWSLPMICIGGNFRSFLLALERNAVLMRISVLGVIVNFIANYILIYGHFGAPALGLEGAAWATLFTNTAMFVTIMARVQKEPLTRSVRLFLRPFRPDWSMFWKIVRLSLPSTFGLLSEVGMFQGAVLLMGWIGVSELAAFGLVLQLASLTFMIPLGFSIVASVRAGQSLGRNDRAGLIMVAKSTTIVVMFTMVVTATLFLVFPHQLLSLLLNQEASESAKIIELGVIYLAFAAAFQLADGAQVVAISILRGMLDMAWPSLIAFVSYICFGLASGYYLAFIANWRGQGVWMGLVIGLCAAAVFLWLRFYLKSRPQEFASLAR